MVEPLGSHHGHASFSWGEPSLDCYIRRQAFQATQRRSVQILVATGDPPERIASYHMLSAASFEKNDLPAEFATRLLRYPMPATIIGRLTIDLRSQRSGLDETLLLDVLRRQQSRTASPPIF